jgi:hypothetical protein
MLDLDFIIKNPWAKNPTTASPFKGLSWTRSVGKYKQIEVQLGKLGSNPLDIQLNTDWRGYDHAGPHVVLSVFGIMLSLGVYDTRHWDDAKNSWDTPTPPPVVVIHPTPTSGVADAPPVVTAPAAANDNATPVAPADHSSPSAPSSQ